MRLFGLRTGIARPPLWRVPRSLLAAVLLSLAVPCAPGLALDQGTDIKATVPPEDVRRGLAFRDAAIRNLAARITYDERSRVSRAGPFRNRIQVIEAVWEGPWRGRADILEEPAYNLGTKAKARLIMTCDEHGSRRLAEGRRRSPIEKEGAVPGAFGLVGRIMKESGLFWAITPSQLLAIGTSSPSMCFETTQVGELRECVIGGRRAIRLDFTADSQNPPGSALKGTIWLAPEFGYAVLRSELERRPTPSSPWKPVSVVECGDYANVDAVWLPRWAKTVEHTYWDNGDYELKRELSATFADWKVNQELKAGTFSLQFPKGTVVVDHTRGGVTYVQGRIDDAGVRRSAGKAKAMVATAAMPAAPSGVAEGLDDAAGSSPFRRTDSWGKLVVPLAGAGSVGLAVLVLLARRYRTRGGAR